MYTNRIALSNIKTLTDPEKERLLKQAELFVEFKRKEAEAKKLADSAKKARESIEATLNSLCEDLKSSKDFEITLEGDKEKYFISSKASSTTFYSEEDLQEKIKKNLEEKMELDNSLVWTRLGKEVIKSEPRVTFNIKTI